MIGPLSARKDDLPEKQLMDSTMIDPATGWFEVAPVSNIDSASCQAAFDDYWLSRYPHPQYLGYDNGKDVKKVFEEMQANYEMAAKPSSKYNPQSNRIIERVHQVLNDSLRTFDIEKIDLDPVRPWD